ncbi:MAG: hypothetical protein MK078_11575 [Crocinitomicaceae bacterium]|nr:hypothetical protein [Crocinitomicaceae bacterium]
MKKLALVFALLLVFNAVSAQEKSRLIGHWKGIQMFQDESSYDGETIYLPNSDYMVIDANTVHVYFYPYYKSDAFEMFVKDDEIRYKINGKRIESKFEFRSDTLVLTMNFINKKFIKMYEPASLDSEVLAELDEFGFNPSSLMNEYELDTFHDDYKIGFKDYDELNFDLIYNIQFLNDKEVKINKGKAVSFSRGYHTIRFIYENQPHQFMIAHAEGTQRLAIIPTSDCRCDSLVVPYIASSWGDRIRKSIIDYENY